MRSLGLYIHIPFCKSFCPYCDFYKVRIDNELMEKYTEAVIERTASFSDNINLLGADDFFVDTIYFGGGTPSVMSGEQISRMLKAVREKFHVSENAEITIECNPSSELESFIPAVTDAGVNRLSFGVQSSVEEERKMLGRSADRKRIRNALKLARDCGVENLNLDVMMGIPGQTKASLDKTLEFCVGEGAKHVSAYILNIEENTFFDKRRDKLDLPDEKRVCDFYKLTCDTLEREGIKQYEISNFSLPSYESKHNLKYWRCLEYLGIGPAAHSFVNGRRFYFERDIRSFIGGADFISDGEGGDYEEKLMLALRLRDGFSYSDGLKAETAEKAKSPKLAPYLISDERGIRLTRDGFLVSNAVIAELI